MKNFLNVFAKLPMGGQLVDLCFCNEEMDGEENYSGLTNPWRGASAKDTYIGQKNSLLPLVPGVSDNISCKYSSNVEKEIEAFKNGDRSLASVNPKPSYNETVPLHLLPQEEKNVAQRYLEGLNEKSQNPKKDC